MSIIDLTKLLDAVDAVLDAVPIKRLDDARLTARDGGTSLAVISPTLIRRLHAARAEVRVALIEEEDAAAASEVSSD